MSRKSTSLSWGQLRFFELILAIKRDKGERVELSDLLAIHAELKRRENDERFKGRLKKAKLLQVK